MYNSPVWLMGKSSTRGKVWRASRLFCEEFLNWMEEDCVNGGFVISFSMAFTGVGYIAPWISKLVSCS